MIQYYKTRPTPEDPNIPSEDEDPTHLICNDVSEFDKHRESLLSDDLEEGWASELRRYLGTMQRNVKKDTNIVEWGQVSILSHISPSCINSNNRTTLYYFRLSHGLLWTSFLRKRLQCHASAFSQAPNKLRQTGVHPSALKSSKSS